MQKFLLSLVTLCLLSSCIVVVEIQRPPGGRAAITARTATPPTAELLMQPGGVLIDSIAPSAAYPIYTPQEPNPALILPDWGWGGRVLPDDIDPGFNITHSEDMPGAKGTGIQIDTASMHEWVIYNDTKDTVYL